MKARVLVGAAALMAGAATAFGFTVEVDSFAANPGRVVEVPVRVATASEVAYAAVELKYDPQVVVCTRVEAGALGGEFAEMIDDAGKLTVRVNFDDAQKGVTGVLAKVALVVRDGTAGHFSDLAVTRVSAGDASGVRDIFVADPVKISNGMVRSVAATADVKRLESAFCVASATSLASLTLADGDAIQAGGAAVTVFGAVAASGAIAVAAPTYGWTSAKYALLTTPTTGLSFALEGLDSATITSETANGLTTYYATVAIAGEGEIVCAAETLDATTKSQIRNYAAAAIAKLDTTKSENAAIKTAFESGKTITVKGPSGGASVALISDMGLAPAFAVDATGALTMTYATPTLAITSFDPATGKVGIKVTPGEGNQIVANINTGYVHVYGTDDLNKAMKLIEQVGFDMTPYLKEETKGEGTLTVTLGTHTFLKVLVGK